MGSLSYIFSSTTVQNTSKMVDAKSYGWENRVKFIVKFLYDIDNNGSLDKNDFECLAVRNTVIEGKGAWDEAKYKANSEIMAKLWNEIADLADFDKDGEVSVPEFIKAIDQQCKGKSFDAFPKLAADAPDGITLAKYQELYAGFIANENSANADLACLYLFGPLQEI